MRHRLLRPLRAAAIYELPVEMPSVEVTVHWHETFDNDEGNRWFRELTIETLRQV